MQNFPFYVVQGLLQMVSFAILISRIFCYARALSNLAAGGIYKTSWESATCDISLSNCNHHLGLRWL